MNERHGKMTNSEHVGVTRPIATSVQLDAVGSSHGEKGSGMRLLSKSTMVLALTLLISLFMYGGWFAPESSHAALQYVGGASATGTAATYNVSLTGLTGGLGSAAQAGDLVIVVTGWASSADGNPGVTTAGYTEVYDGYASDTRRANVSVNWKIMGGSPDTLVTVSGFNNAANGGATVVQVWRGADPATPMDVAAPSAPLGVSAINQSRPNSPAITPVTSGAVVIAVGLGTGAAAPTAMTAPAGFINGLSATGAGSTMGVVANIASQAWAGGAVDPAAWTGGVTSTSDCWSAGTLAIRPLVLIDALSVTANTALAASATPLATGVQMQMLQVDCNATGDSSCSIDSITVDDLGTAGATDITNLHIYIDTDSTFAGAVGPITQAGFSGSSTPVSLLSWTTERIITSGTSKYLWVVYDLAASAETKTLQSSVTSIAVDSPDTGAAGTWNSNIVNVTSGPASTINSCAGCHGYPNPLDDGTARNTPEGQFVGDHAKHNYVCSTCHLTPVTETGIDYAHRDGNINIKSGTIGIADNGTYTRGSSFAQNNNPTTGTCNAVDCHANAVTPQWGVGTTGCSSCHALPPATNAHIKHYTEKGWATGSFAMCVVCHPDNTAGHSDVADNTVAVILTPAGTSPAITCASATASGCHIDKTTPAWNTTGIACLGCHTLGGASNNPTSALHDTVPSITGEQHDDSFDGGSGTCISCHTSLAAQSTHANGIFSSNGFVPGDKTAMGLAAFYTATADNTGSCSNTSCHLSFSDDWAHQWYDAASYYTTDGSACGGCHGDWVRGWNTGVLHRTTANTQSTHGDGGTNYECYECHALEHAVYPFTWSTNDWLPAGGTSKHGNSGIEVNNAGTTYNTTSGYCTACHTSGIFNFSDTSWAINSVAGATVVSTCYSCHGGDNATIGNTNYWPGGVGATYPDRSAEHNVHIQALATQLGYPFNGTLTDQQQKTMCAYCHVYSTAPGEAGHGDNVAPADVAAAAFNPLWSALTANYPTTPDGGTAAAYTAGNGVNGTCAGLDCHNNKSTTTAYDWYDGATSACIMCHSDFTIDASHVAHTGAQGTYGGAVISCTNCHGTGTTTTTEPTTGHINGTFAVAGTTTFTYTGVYPTKGTCGVNQCHNNGKYAATPAYTWATPLSGCAQCHGDTSVNLTTQAHVAHLTANTTFGMTIGCGNCHAAATATTHFDGTITMPGTTTFTYTGGDVLVAGTTFGTCGTNNCHRSDASANVAPAVNPLWNAGALANCSICHLEAMTSNKHAQHLASNSLPGTAVNECYNCHNTTATAAGLATGANHLNAVDNVNFNTTNMNYEASVAAVAAGTGGTTTCNNIKCHNGVTTPQWSATVSCFSCHNTGGTGPLPSAASVIGKHTQHANNDADYTDCALCHANAASYTAVGGHTDHQNLTVNVTMTGITYADAANTAGGVNYATAGATHIDDGTCTSTTGCHGAATLTGGWASAATLANGCFACHGGSLTATETSTAKPLVDTIPNPVNNTQYTSQGHGNTTTFPGSGVAGPGTTFLYTGTPGCYNCHSSGSTHSPAASATDPFRLGAFASDTNGLCMQAACHPSSEVQSHMKSIIGGTTTWVNNYDYKCVDCHDPHGDTNYYMVRSAISAPTATNDVSFGSDTYGTPLDAAGISAVTFNSLAGNAAGSYGVSGATNGVCEVCHVDTTEVAYYRRGNAETNTHNVTGDCTTCHKHLDGFKGAGCTGCHGGDNATITNKNFWPGGAGATYPDRTGEHNIHIQRLAAKLGYPFNDTLTDQQQKTMCAYCHVITADPGESGHDTGGAPADLNATSFNPTWSILTGNYPSTADGGTAASYTAGNGVNGTCAGIDCHNNKSTTTAYDWYDGATSACMMCHTPDGTANNPGSGVHKAGTLTSATPHDDSFGTGGTCTTCHTVVPALGPATTHMNGTFTVNEATATNEYYTSTAIYTDAAANAGTCSGATVGAAGCHDSIFDAGSWVRKWSLTAYNVDGTQCANCHGGMNETDWTFGSVANLTDYAVEHNRNWDGDANTGEVIGAHLNATANATKCNMCHVYNDAPYSMTWGTGNHGNNKITMNSTVGYTDTTWNCSSSCHASNTGHNLESSANATWLTRGEAIAGPALACTACHTGSGTGPFKVGAASTHTDPDGTGATYAAGGNHCAVCHFVSHATETTNTIGVTWDTRTMGTSYVTGDGKIHLKNNINTVKTYEAQVCWGCHWDADVTSLPTAIKEFGPTQGVYTTGTLTATPTSTGNWFAATWTSANFGYKTAAINSMHQAVADLDTAITIDTAHVATDVATIGCTSCHDVHKTANNGFTPTNAYVRGSWTSNPFKEDGAPLSTGQTITSNRGAVPRGIDGTAANGYGGWQIEQNNATFTNTTYAGATGYGGLCANCHTQAALEAMLWTGHDGAVSGFTGNTNNDILTETKRGGTAGWTRGYMSYNSVTTYRSSTWVGGLRNNREWADGITPRDIDSLQTGTPIGYPAGAVTTITSPTGYQNNFHNFPCSKCHSPHASRLPRLMITNCLDVSHNTWDNALNPSTWAAADTHTAKQLAYSSTAQNCHRYVVGTDTNKENTSASENGWNSVTPW